MFIYQNLPENSEKSGEILLKRLLRLLYRDRTEASEGLAISLNDFLKHRLRSYPNAFLAIHRLIYDHVLESFRMLCYVKDTIDVALEMSVVLFHGILFINGCYDLSRTAVVAKLT